MHVSRASSPALQHLLSSSRYGWNLTVPTPVLPRRLTSQYEPWHDPQKSTDASGDSFAGLKIASFVFSFGRFRASWNETPSTSSMCAFPGPWHASQLTPGISRAGSKLLPNPDAVV